MATKPLLATLDAAVARRQQFAGTTVVGYYLALTKPEINFLIAITTGASFCLAVQTSASAFPWSQLLHTILGTTLVASGAATLNQLIEMRFDAKMRRTARRPLASGKIQTSHALWFGIVLSAAGAVYLVVKANPLAALIALLTVVTYLFVYTPLKRITPLSTLAGAIPGAAPPLIGWAAAGGRFTLRAWALYAIVYLWQFPHFMAIAWMYREDYARAGYRVLPSGESRNRFVVCQTVAGSAALLPASLIAIGARESLWSYSVLVLSSAFFIFALRFIIRRSTASARQLLTASIIYLPVLFVFLLMEGN